MFVKVLYIVFISKRLKVSKRLKPLFLDLYFQYCKYSHASKFFCISIAGGHVYGFVDKIFVVYIEDLTQVIISYEIY